MPHGQVVRNLALVEIHKHLGFVDAAFTLSENVSFTLSENVEDLESHVSGEGFEGLERVLDRRCARG
jgi:hypothetical protein